MKNEKIYDVLILGGGPAGYTAAMYAARAGLSALVLEKMGAGGQMILTHQIDNYPGFEAGIDGYTLGDKMKQGAERFGAETVLAEVKAARLTGEIKEIETAKEIFRGRTVIIATGAHHRSLGHENEQELIGRGVNYCAACDGMLYRGKTVAVVGGGNTAAADALLLSRICEKVILVHRRDELRATKIYHEPLMNASNVEFKWSSTVQELVAEERVKALKLRNVNDGEVSEVPVDGVFISIGRAPETGLFEGQLDLDNGYIVAGEDTRTNLPGVFAAGDVRTKTLRQIVTAVSDGAQAAQAVEEYLAEHN